MTKRARWILALVLLLAVAAAVVALRRGSTQTAASAARAASAPTPAIELAAGDVATAAMAELSSLLQVSGGLKASRSALVKAKVAAELTELTVREGDRVAAGQLIGRLDATEFRWRLRQAEDQAAAAQAQLDIAKRTLANNQALVAQGFISRNALDTSESSAAGAAASLQAARAAAELSRKAVADSEVRAPIAGLVAQRLAQPGERVPVDGRIVEIVDLSRIELEAAVAPEDVLGLRIGQAARVQVDGLAEELPARVLRINPAAAAGTRSVMAYIELAPGAAAAGLRQGLFARATIELQRRSALVVPASALRVDQARPQLLVVEGGQARQRAVRTGARGEVLIDGRPEAAVEILEGVAPGATVLRGTVGTLRDGTPVTLARATAAKSAAAGPAASAAR